MKDIERLERAKKVLQELAERAEEGTPIIVEGKKDKEALIELGIKGKIVIARSPLIAAERVSGSREAIVLTDCDRRGRILAGKIRDVLLNEGVRPNMRFRAKLSRYTGMVFVEGLSSLFLGMEIESKKSKRKKR